MDYLYETHLHTSQGSACGSATGGEQAKRYKELGYTGIIVTDHFFNGNSAVKRSMTWEQKVEVLFSGYEDAKRVGDDIGLQVFFGWEAGFLGTEFLIYGLGKEWLLQHEEIMKWSVEQQYEHIHEAGGMVIHAHPYRKAIYIPKIRLYPDHVDGIEVLNAANDSRNPNYNKKALAYAKKLKLPMTAGSDAHSVDAPHTAMVFTKRIEDIEDFTQMIKGNKCIQFTNEF